MQAPARPIWSSPPTLVMSSGLAVMVLMILLGLAHFYNERQRAIQDQLDRNTLFARVMDDQITQGLATNAILLDSVANRLAMSPSAAPHTPQDLRYILPSAPPMLRSLTVVDRTGRVVASTDTNEFGTTIALDRLGLKTWPRRDWIGINLPVRNLAELAAGTPDKGRAAGVGAIPLARPLNLQGGEHLAILLINPQAIENTMRLALGHSGAHATLTRYDADPLATTHPSDLLTFDAQSHAIFSQWLPAKEHGSMVTQGLDGEQQATAFRVSRSHPLVIIVERPLRDVIAEWLIESRLRIALATIAVVVVGLLTALAFHSTRLRERARERLVHQLAFMERLLEISPLPTAMLDTLGCYRHVNRAWELFTGRKAAEVLGTTARSYQPSDQAVIHDQVDRELLAGGQATRYQARMARHDGQMRDLVVNKVSVPGESGRPQGILVTFSDVTELRDSERAIREARDAAEEAARAKGEFIANISHELRTPLQSIIGFSELGSLRASRDERVASMFSDIHASGRRMLALVNDLLDVAKIESAIGTIHLESTDLRPLVREVGRELTPLLTAKRQRLELELGEHALLARVDPLRIQQVLRNVLANALKFAPPETSIDLHASIRRDGGVRLSVRDHGPGIPPSEVDAIFDAFVQSSRTKDGSGGTGLGLSICRKIVEAHGGSIRAENATDGGARFLIDLPSRGAATTIPGLLPGT